MKTYIYRLHGLDWNRSYKRDLRKWSIEIGDKYEPEYSDYINEEYSKAIKDLNLDRRNGKLRDSKVEIELTLPEGVKVAFERQFGEGRRYDSRFIYFVGKENSKLFAWIKSCVDEPKQAKIPQLVDGKGIIYVLDNNYFLR